MVIALLIALVLSIPLTGFITLKAVQLGLRWKIEAEKKESPSMDSPATPIVTAVKKKIDRSVVTKKEQEEESIMNEYFGTDYDPLNQNLK